MGDRPKGVMKRVSEKTTNEILFENITIHRPSFAPLEGQLGI